MNEKSLRIFAAVKAGDIAAVQAYLDAGGDPDTVDGDGNTLLHAALDADTPDPELAGLLIAHGADVNRQDVEGNTTLQLALLAGYFPKKHREIAEKQKALLCKLNVLFSELVTHGTRDPQPPTFPSFPDILSDFPKSLGPERIVIARALVEAGADVNVQGANQSCLPLNLAAYFGEKALMQFFLENGADIKLLDDEGLSAVDYALAGSHMDAAHWLESRGGVSHKEQFSKLLQLCWFFENTEGPRYLLSQGADPNTRIDDKPLLLGSLMFHNETMSRLLIEHGADVDARFNGEEDIPLLAGAIMMGNSSALDLLLEYGADANAVDSNGQSVLGYAVMWGRDGMLRVLLERGADANGISMDRHALHWAVLWRRYEAARILLEHGADVDARTEETPPALYYAVMLGDMRMVRLLLEHGADADANTTKAKRRFFPSLFMSLQHGRLDIAEVLLEHGAGLDLKGDDTVFDTSLAWAIDCSRHYEARRMENARDEGVFDRYNPEGFDLMRALELLAAHGADVNAKNFMGETALHAAAFSGREDAAAWLLDRGADVAAEIVREDYYRTPLMSAAWGCHPGMMRLLMEHGADIRADGTKILAMFEEDADKKARAEESGVYQLVLDALGASAAASAADKPGGMAAAVAGIPGFGIAGAAVGILPNIFGRYTASRAAGRLRGSGPRSAESAGGRQVPKGRDADNLSPASPSAESEKAFLQKAKTLAGQGRNKEALAALQAGAERHPQSEKLWDSLARQLSAAGQWGEASKAYERLCEIAPRREMKMYYRSRLDLVRTKADMAELEKKVQSVQDQMNRMNQLFGKAGEQEKRPLFRHAGDLARKIAENGLLPRLLELRRSEGEADWLEFKAAVIPDTEHKAADRKKYGKALNDDCYVWNDLVKPILALRNSRGGLLLIGVDDHADVLGLDIRGSHEDYLLKEIHGRLRRKTYAPNLNQSTISLEKCEWAPFAMKDWLRATVEPIGDKKIVCLCVAPIESEAIDVEKYYVRESYQRGHELYVPIRQGAESKPIPVNDYDERREVKKYFAARKDADLSDLYRVWAQLNRGARAPSASPEGIGGAFRAGGNKRFPETFFSCPLKQ